VIIDRAKMAAAPIKTGSARLIGARNRDTPTW